MSYRKWTRAIAFTSLLTSLSFFTTAYADNDKDLASKKVKGSLSVMVLGSGGPVATIAGRASASYLIFIEGQPKILMDAGGGAYKSLAMSGVDIKDLDIVLLSHLHLDHTGDLPSIIKTMYFHNRIFNIANDTFPPGRTAPFRVFGPNTNNVPYPPIPPGAPPLGNDADTAQYPPTTEHVDGHYDVNDGIDRYLNIFSRAISGGIFKYEAANVSPNWMAYNPDTIIDEMIIDENGFENRLVIKAVGVNHGPVPALAFRIEYKGKSIVYSGDTSSRSTKMDDTALANGGNMVEISEGADLLIYDTALSTDTPPGPSFGIFYALHTTPSRIGEVANAAGVKKLVLSHITPQTENKIPQVRKLIRAQGYTGKIKAAKDLKVFNLHD